MNQSAVLIPKSGIPSEVWAWRQASYFKRTTAKLVCWEIASNSAWSFDSSTVELGLPWARKAKLPRRIRALLGFARLSEIRETRRLESALRECDVALCHFGWTAVRAYEAFERLNLPFVVIFHGLDLADSQLQGAYLQKLKKVINRANALVVVGSHMIEVLAAIEPRLERSKVHVIPCGAPLDQFSGRRFPIREQGSPLWVASVGRLFDGKGVDVALKAVALARKSQTDVRINIVGDGPERSELEALVEALGLEDSVVFHGMCDPERVADILSNSHVLVQPSRKSRTGWIEGFGVSITEAMASGLPVIATRSGGIPDQVRDGKDGFLVEIDDDVGISDAISRYNADEALRQVHGRSASQRAQAFDTKTMSNNVETLLIDAGVNR